VADRIDHDHDHKAEDDRDADDAERPVVCRVGDDRPAPCEHEREGGDALGGGTTPEL
jgi:hypothetical protein